MDTSDATGQSGMSRRDMLRIVGGVVAANGLGAATWGALELMVPAATAETWHKFIIGANPFECHAPLFERVQQRRRASKQCQLIVVDPRRTRTAELADMHLAPVPGTDLLLLNCHGQAHLARVRRTPGSADYTKLMDAVR